MIATPQHNLFNLLQALRESRHHSAQQQSLDKQLRECVYNIRNKEDLIAALNRNDLQAKQLSQQYLVSSLTAITHRALHLVVCYDCVLRRHNIGNLIISLHRLVS